MPIEMRETRPRGQTDEVKLDGSRERREYILWNSTDVDDVRNHLKANTPATVAAGTLIKQTHNVEPLGVGLWRGEVIWGAPSDRKSQEPQQPGDGPIVSFDTTGGRATIREAIAQEVRDAAGVVAGGGVLGKTIEFDPIAKQVRGVEATVPKLRFTQQRTYDAADITDAHIKLLAERTGTTNDGVYGEYARGELLFEGAQGTLQVDDQKYQVVKHWEASKNVAGLDVDGIAVPLKRGHEYLWAYYDVIEDGANKVLAPKAKFACVAQIYGESDFADLEP